MASSGSDLTWQGSSAPQHGVVGDANTMLIDPSFLGMAQDVIIDTSGILRNRGGIKTYTSDTFTGLQITGLTQTTLNLVYNGGTVLALKDGSNNNQFLYGTSASALTGFAKLTATGTSATSQVFCSNTGQVNFTKLPNDAGAIFTLQRSDNMSSWGQPGIWGGNATLTSDTTTGTAASTIGSKAIAGVGTSWTTALLGAYLFIGAGAAAKYVGQVDQVTSTTTIVLKRGAIATIAAAAPIFKTARLPMYMVYKGRITTNTASAVVVGSNTKFASSGPGGSGATWMTATAGATVFRKSDGGFIGTVTSVQNDTTLTLTGNAAIAMVNEEYYIVNNANTTYLINAQPGAAFTANCSELYSDRFWWGAIAANDTSIKTTTLYMNSAYTAPFNEPNSVAFSKKGEPEMLDLDPSAGDVIKLPASSNADAIRALYATSGGLLIFRSFDTFLLTGYSPETFRVVKILDDGCWGASAVKGYKEGVVWAGPKSLWYFDGTRVVDLLKNTVKKFYVRSTATQLSSIPLAVVVSNDHLMFSYYSGSLASGDRAWPSKNTTKTINLPTIVVNMLNGAVSFFTNIYVTGDLKLSDTTGASVIATSNTPGTDGFLINGDILFGESSTASDNFDSLTGAVTFQNGAQIGPDVMFETTKLTMGDATRLKFWKRFLLNYSADVSMTATMMNPSDTTFGFPNISTGTASTDTVAVSSQVEILHRLRFLVRAPALAIRVYQTSTTSATSQRFKCFWWAVGGKKMRQGRVQA